MSASDIKQCPFCSEEIKATAIKCKHCASMLDAETEAAFPTSPPTGDENTMEVGAASWQSLGGPLTIGTEVENYRVSAIIGKGGMGEVYRAEHKLSEQTVALKVVSPELMKIEGLRARFLKEARVMAKLHHPNIVQLHNFFEEGNRFFMAMEYLEGKSLKQVVRKEPLPVEEVVRIGKGVLTGLEYAHTRPESVIHRDIKPDNIFLTDDGRVVIIDFGVAKAIGTEKLTRTGATVGTCEYMAPEQVVGEQVVPATDVYAVGISLYKALAGVVPFPQKSDSGFDVMRAHVEDPPPPLRTHGIEVPEWIQAVIDMALAKRLKDRYPSAKAMAEALGKGPSTAVQPTPIIHPPTDAGSASHAPPTQPVTSPPPAPPPPTSSSHPNSNRKLLYAFIGVVISAVVVIGGILLNGPPPADPPAHKIAKPAPSVSSPAHNPQPTTHNASEPETLTPPPEELEPVPDQLNTVQDNSKAEQGQLNTAQGNLTVTPGQLNIISKRHHIESSNSIQDSSTANPAPNEKPVVQGPARQPVPATPPDDKIAESGQLPTPNSQLPIPKLPHCIDNMCLVPAGEFKMGCNRRDDLNCSALEPAQIDVQLDSFWMDRSEVTFKAYGECVEAGACSAAHTDDGKCLVPKGKVRFGEGILDDHFQMPDKPVICVTWNQASAYCQWLNKRLPTEAQWEKAARGSDGRLYPWGNRKASCDFAVMVNESDQRACSLNSTWTVCSKPSGNSLYGICDLAGNIWEWCFDPWVEKPDSWSRNGKAVGTAVPDKRVMRGGSWTRTAPDVRSSFRDWLTMTRSGCGVGFRCIKEASSF